MSAFTETILNLRAFPPSLPAIVKEQWDNYIDEWRFTAKQNAHHSGTGVDPRVPTSPKKSFLRDGFPVLTHRKLERAHTRDHKHMSHRAQTESSCPSSPPGFIRWRYTPPTQPCSLIADTNPEIDNKSWQRIRNQTFRFARKSNSTISMLSTTAPIDSTAGRLIMMTQYLIAFQR